MLATPHLEQGGSQTPGKAEPDLIDPVSISLAERG